MAKLLGVFTHHHDSDRRPWRAFVESEADALASVLAGEYQMALREPADVVLARAKGAGKYGTLARAVAQGYEDEDPEEDATAVVVWDYLEDDGTRNLGCGEEHASALPDLMDHTVKRDNTWIHVEEWTPDPAQKAELESLSKDELVQRLLEVQALR